MKPQFQHEVMTSFMLWFDNHLLTKGEAFSNQTGQLYYFEDDRLPDSFNVFASPYKQWVTDSSVPGAEIPTTLMGTGRSNSSANNDAITGFSVSNVGPAISANNFDGVFDKLNTTKQNLVFRSQQSLSLRIRNSAINESLGHSRLTGKWELKDTNQAQSASVAWRATNTGYSFPWQVPDWTRVNAVGGSFPAFDSFLVSGLTGFTFDFENGRVLETGNLLDSSALITGTFAVKDFNIYITNDSEEDLILNSSLELNSRYGKILSGVKPYDKMLPAVFINSELTRNEGFAFGGEDKTTNSIKAVVMSENQYQLDGILSIFADTRYTTFTKIPFTGHPTTELGDIKNGSFNYTNLVNEFKSPTGEFYIENVVTSKLAERTETALPGDVKVGFVDFDVSINRFPRA